MVVDEIMSDTPFVVRSDEPVADVLRKLMEADVRHLPVVQEQELVGIVSDRDLREYVPSLRDELEQPEAAAQRLARPISQLMSTDLAVVNPESDVAEAIDLMLELKVGAIPVVEPDSTRLVGIMSYMDALRVARDLL